MKTEPDYRIHALNLLREWSVWMVGIESVLLGFLVTLLGNRQLALSSPTIKGAALSFGLSIVMAAWVLGALPSICQRLGAAAKNVYAMPPFDLPGLRFLTLRWFVVLQHGFFFLGMGALMMAIVQGDFGRL